MFKSFGMLCYVIEQVVPAILMIFMPLSLGLSSKKHIVSRIT